MERHLFSYISDSGELLIFATLTTSVTRPLLLRIALRLHVFALRRAYKTSTQLNYLVRNRLRYIDKDTRLEGYEPHYDEVNLVAASRILKPALFRKTSSELHVTDESDRIDQELISRYEPIHDEVEEIVSRTSDDTIVQYCYHNYWRVQQYISRLTSHDHDHRHTPAPNSVPDDDLDTANLFDLEWAIRKKVKATRDLIADRQALKLDLRGMNFMPIASILFGLFVVSGYFYQSILLSSFGLSVGHYFSLYSYLSSSLDSIYNAAASAGIALIAAFFYLDAESRSPSSSGTPQSSFDWMRLLAYAACFVGLYVFYEYKTVFLFYLHALGILAGAHLSSKIALSHFRQPLHAMFILSFLIFFFVGMYTDVAKTIHQFRHAEWPSLPIHTIQYSSASFSDLPREGAVLSASESYLFVIDERRRVYVVPKTEVAALHRKR